jgi:hypothetical protein
MNFGRRWGLRWIAVGLAGMLGFVGTSLPADLADFAALGGRLLGGHLDGIYDGGWNQAGPLQLILSRLFLVGGRDGMPSPLLMAGIDAALMLAALSLAGPASAARSAATAVLTLIWLAGPVPWNGHPAETLVPLAWAYAVRRHRRDRTLAAACTLALAVAVAPWAVLGFPSLLAVPGRRRALRTGILAAGLGVLAYLPFVLTGHFGMFGHVWGVAPGSVVHLLLPGLRQVTWTVRLAQAIIVAGGCGLVGWRFRGQPAAALLAAALLRVLTDPLTYGYYWTPVAVLSVLLVAVTRTRIAPVVVLGYLAALASAVGSPLGAAGCLGVLVLVLLSADEQGVEQAGEPLPGGGQIAVEQQLDGHPVVGGDHRVRGLRKVGDPLTQGGEAAFDRRP